MWGLGFRGLSCALAHVARFFRGDLPAWVRFFACSKPRELIGDFGMENYKGVIIG